MAAFEKSMEVGADERVHLAKSILVSIVRGLFSKLQSAYIQFHCNSLYGYKLYDIFWEAVGRLEICCFNVLACTCDDLSVYIHFFRIHSSKESLTKWSIHWIIIWEVAMTFMFLLYSLQMQD